MEPNSLIHQYLLGNLDASEVEQLQRLLVDDPALRQEYLLATGIDAGLRELAIQNSIEDATGTRQDQKVDARHGFGLRQIRGWFAAMATLAAAIAVMAWMSFPSTVATIVSSENAAWESSLPTSPGSDLEPGALALKSGIATIRFRSGAEMILEAPSSVELISPMRTKLNSGAALIEVPESAKGFVLETPKGFAVDFGTSFAVEVGESESGFELISGEIEVHHAASGESLRLQDVGATASVSSDAVRLIDEEMLSKAMPEAGENEKSSVIRVATNGRSGSAPHNESARERGAIKPEYLYVKTSREGKWDIRSFFEFDLQAVPMEKLTTAKLRLNMVPSYRGSASLLPKVNRFAIYGMTNPEKANWKVDSFWEQSPGPEDGVLLGKFEALRSQQRGSFEIDSKELLAFLKDQGQKPVTFIFVRETTREPGRGASMTHMFASDKHPESVGPLLELGLD